MEAVTTTAERRELILHVGAPVPIPYSYRHGRAHVITKVAITPAI